MNAHQLIYHQSSLPFPFAKATEFNQILYLSGQVSLAEDATPIYGSVSTQTQRIMTSISNTLIELQSDLNQIIKVTVWLSDMSHFEEFNKAYRTFFSQGFPARSVVCSKLAFGLDVEIEVQALKIIEI